MSTRKLIPSLLALAAIFGITSLAIAGAPKKSASKPTSSKQLDLAELNPGAKIRTGKAVLTDKTLPEDPNAITQTPNFGPGSWSLDNLSVVAQVDPSKIPNITRIRVGAPKERWTSGISVRTVVVRPASVNHDGSVRFNDIMYDLEDGFFIVHTDGGKPGQVMMLSCEVRIYGQAELVLSGRGYKRKSAETDHTLSNHEVTRGIEVATSDPTSYPRSLHDRVKLHLVWAVEADEVKASFQVRVRGSGHWTYPQDGCVLSEIKN